jgi:xylulokinase
VASHVLGLDVSTTATKAILVDETGRLVGTASLGYDYDVPRPLWSEQDPQLWWTATQAVIGQALADAGIRGDQVAAVGLAGQMHGAVLLDAANDPLRPAILWNDQRTAAECDEVRERVGARRLIEITGNDALTGFTAPKLLWVRRHEPDVWSRVAHVLLPKDFVRHRLTGDHAVDRADGAGTLLFDLGARDWSTDVLEALDLDRGLLPTTHEGPSVTGTVTDAAAAATGLAPGTPVVAGGGDQAANAVGVGAVDPGVVALSLGTSGVVFAATDRPIVEREGRVHSFCHSVPGRWHLMSVMLSAAGSLRWFRDALAPDATYDELDAEAASVGAGSGGLVFLPYLTGERSPHPDPLARGAFVGLTVSHERRHLTRAVLEGVAFGLRDGMDQMTAIGLASPEQIRASGGGMASAVWRQILADVLRAEIATVATGEGAAFGAALLAAVGAGWFPDVAAAADRLVRVTPVAEPGSNASAYAEALGTYRTLYPALAPIFHAQGSAR